MNKGSRSLKKKSKVVHVFAKKCDNIEIMSHWLCKGVLLFQTPIKECSLYNQQWILNCPCWHIAWTSQYSYALDFFFLTTCLKKIRLMWLFGISVSWWTHVFPQITSLCAKSPCQQLDRTIRVYTKASST